MVNLNTSHRDSFKEMLDSVSEKHSFEECKQVLRDSEMNLTLSIYFNVSDFGRI